MKILVTGFDPFGGESVNPAYEAVKLLPDTIAGAEIVKLEIPTVFSKSGPAVELMALNFAIVELGLYLDTHKDDKEAFALYTNYVKLYQEGKEKYEKLYGPIEHMSTARLGSYSWLNDPWPWEYEGGTK